MTEKNKYTEEYEAYMKELEDDSYLYTSSVAAEDLPHQTRMNALTFDPDHFNPNVKSDPQKWDEAEAQIGFRKVPVSFRIFARDAALLKRLAAQAGLSQARLLTMMINEVKVTKPSVTFKSA